ncbi:MAG TPA: DUF4864 domain-containing protein [Paucimonas sp.]|nr:DUF4864 domain-containing protein [Paucimonas sp.]
MKCRLLATASLLCALGLPVSGNALAEPVQPLDAKHIQAVVKSHLKALAEDDAARAFAAATSETREQLGSAENFMQLIKEEYSPIYHNRHVMFAPAENIGGQTIQVARVTGADNRVWVAMFRMERDTDESWKIAGCQLLETTSISI